MSAPEVYSITQGSITAHAFNQDRSRKCPPFFMDLRISPVRSYVWLEVAVSLNSKDAQIFSKTKGDWKAKEILSEVRARWFLIPFLCRLRAG